MKAVAYLQKAGEDAASRYANQIALAYLGRALALRPSSATRFELLMIRARVYKHMGHRTDEEADVTALEQLAEQLDDDEARSNAAGRRSSLALETDNFDAATAAAGRAVAWAEAARRVALPCKRRPAGHWPCDTKPITRTLRHTPKAHLHWRVKSAIVKLRAMFSFNWVSSLISRTTTAMREIITAMRAMSPARLATGRLKPER